ncbi:GntR family transcriptional regulator [Hoeflea sp. G2-23]|uniref:GntR family transcriptional regulator n=1 Tax=Hoeflea algicola TaxID=2983763 RepID=A0ABT3Z9R6_9HYPH|nr:GntR family transcriptional regulator [Hoeflea algicola]MCY0148510.1 GntR family transcriptional regulator [Hoeflea algicola]
MGSETVDAPIRGDALAENAYQHIREAISDGTLQPGQRVTETQLANWLSVSRTPIRAAIQRLESEGLFAQSPRQGMIVRQLDYQEVVELYAMREILECNAARLAAQQATEPDIDFLADILELEESVPEGDHVAAARANRTFHTTLHKSAHNRYLIESIAALYNAMILLGGTTLAVDGRRSEALEQHRNLVQAIRDRDGDAAYAAMSNHIRSAQRNRLKLIMNSLATSATLD